MGCLLPRSYCDVARWSCDFGRISQLNTNSLIQCLFYLLAMLAITKPLGWYIAKVYEGEAPGLGRTLGGFEKFLYRLCGVDSKEEMDWKAYAKAVMIFSTVSVFALYFLQRLQHRLPLNPMAMSPIAPDLAWNTAMSFTTNTDWQSYAGETTMSYLTQMCGMVVQNFASAAVGIAVMVALIRGMRGVRGKTIGNFWVDLCRGVLYILLPMSVVLAIVFVWQGIPQTFKPSQTVALVQPTKDSNGNVVAEQIIATGPVASQLSIKQIGTNGGGYFNVNSAHPYENPSPLTMFLELFCVLAIPSALCYTFGKMLGDTRQGWALWAAMTLIFIPAVWLCVHSEQAGNPAFTHMGIDQTYSASQSGGNMEGKEVRAGIATSAFWATSVTATSNGSVVAMHDSFTPLGGLVPLVLIKLGEVIYGGVGCGIYGVMVFVIIAVFMAGLMVGRTPEYMGKKIEAYEVKMASVAALVPAFFILICTAIALLVKPGLAGLANPGAHGLSEALYAFASAGGNNGSAFAGLTASTPFWDTFMGITIFAGRFWVIIPVLAIAGSLVRKKVHPIGPGTLPTHTPLFVFFLACTIIIVGALTFFPAWSLGPVVEHLMMTGA